MAAIEYSGTVWYSLAAHKAKQTRTPFNDTNNCE